MNFRFRSFLFLILLLAIVGYCYFELPGTVQRIVAQYSASRLNSRELILSGIPTGCDRAKEIIQKESPTEKERELLWSLQLLYDDELRKAEILSKSIYQKIFEWASGEKNPAIRWVYTRSCVQMMVADLKNASDAFVVNVLDLAYASPNRLGEADRFSQIVRYLCSGSKVCLGRIEGLIRQALNQGSWTRVQVVDLYGHMANVDLLSPVSLLLFFENLVTGGDDEQSRKAREAIAATLQHAEFSQFASDYILDKERDLNGRVRLSFALRGKLPPVIDILEGYDKLDLADWEQKNIDNYITSMNQKDPAIHQRIQEILKTLPLEREGRWSFTNLLVSFDDGCHGNVELSIYSSNPLQSPNPPIFLNSDSFSECWAGLDEEGHDIEGEVTGGRQFDRRFGWDRPLYLAFKNVSAPLVAFEVIASNYVAGPTYDYRKTVFEKVPRGHTVIYRLDLVTARPDKSRFLRLGIRKLE